MTRALTGWSAKILSVRPWLWTTASRQLGSSRHPISTSAAQAAISAPKPKARRAPRYEPKDGSPYSAATENSSPAPNYIREFCRENNIGMPKELRPMRVQLDPNPAALEVQFSRRHLFEYQRLKYLDSIEHPFSQTLLDIYRGKMDEPLWWGVRVFWRKEQNLALFVTTTAARKIRHAVRDALKVKGYDQFGKKLPAAGGDEEGKTTQELYGTLRVNCAAPQTLCQMKFSELVDTVVKIMDVAEVGLGRTVTDKKGLNNDGQESPYKRKS